MQDDGQGRQEIVPSLLTQDTINPSFYGIRIIATELEVIIDKLAAQVGPTWNSMLGPQHGARLHVVVECQEPVSAMSQCSFCYTLDEIWGT